MAKQVLNCILLFGLLLHILEIQLSWKLLRMIMIVVCILGHVPCICEPFTRVGPDYSAYPNQASAFAAGETNYQFISSKQGYCMYMASHLWHYLFVYKLAMLTRWAEVLIKVLTIFLHVNTLILILNLARCVFVRRMDKVQLVAFMLATNHRMIRNH